MEEGSVTAVTFNRAAPWGSLLDNTWSYARMQRFAHCMNTIQPDIIGTQELNQAWQP